MVTQVGVASHMKLSFYTNFETEHAQSLVMPWLLIPMRM